MKQRDFISRTIFLAILLMPGISLVYAQTSRQVAVSVSLTPLAIMDIEPDNSGIILSFPPPVDAGSDPFLSVTPDNTKWINYSSCLVAGGVARTITAQISGTLPPGIDLEIKANPYSGSGNGELGIPSGSVALTDLPLQIISGIGSAHTGTGAGNGHQIEYRLSVSNMSDLNSASTTTVTVMFTIVE